MKRNIKKTVALLLICVLILGTFGACGKTNETPDGNKGNGQGNKDPELENKVISVSWYTPWWMDASAYDYIFDDFARRYPEYTIERNDISDLPSLLASIQAGTQPDVFMGGDPNETNFISGCYQSLFMSLDEYLKNDPDMNFETLDERQMEMTKFINGKSYALPYLTTQFCLVYNKTLFAKAGLDPEKPPKTWTEFYDYAKKLTKFDSNGVVEQLGVVDGPWTYQFIHGDKSGGELQANGIDSAYNTEWVKRVYEYCATFEEITGGGNALPKDKFGFKLGNAAMQANGNLNYLNEFADSGIDFGLAKLPIPDELSEQVIPSLLWYYFSIPRGAKNPDGGWLFAKYCMTEGIYQTIAKDYQKNPNGVFPQYIAHEPTRTRVYDTFLDGMSEKTKKLLEQRDNLAREEIILRTSSPIERLRLNIGDKWEEKDIGLQEMLNGIHNEYQSTLETWKKDMTNKGWKFEDGKLPVLPDNYDD